MNSNLKNRDALFSFMQQNYLLACQDMPENFKSTHWDVFDSDFYQLIEKRDIWDSMLRNPLTLGFNENLLEISNQRFLAKNDNLWKQLRRGSIKDIVFEKREKELVKEEINLLTGIIGATDIDFVIENCIPDVCSPIITKMKITHGGKNKIINFNRHDAGDLYHAWMILLEMKRLNKPKPIICEIGGGFGGLISKIKSNLRKSRLVMFDLPEVNACQTYYLSQIFDNLSIKGYKDFLKEGPSILQTKFDFLILPGWTISQFERDSVDSYINVRSMMEMSKENLEFYFDAIQRSLKVDGIFSCFNRYSKSVGSFENRFALYPFDDDWDMLLSQPSKFQPHIHQLILKRMKNNSGSNFKQKLRNIEKK